MVFFVLYNKAWEKFPHLPYEWGFHNLKAYNDKGKLVVLVILFVIRVAMISYLKAWDLLYCLGILSKIS